MNRIAALALAFTAIVVIACGDPAGKGSTPDAPPPGAEPKKVNPAPHPDPAPTNTKGKRVSVRFKVTWDARTSRKVLITSDTGHGKDVQTARGGARVWTTTVDAGQTVYLLAVPSIPGKAGWINVAIDRGSEGSPICSDRNVISAPGRRPELYGGGADCFGIA